MKIRFIQNAIAGIVLGMGLVLGIRPVMAQTTPAPEEISADSPRALPIGQIDATKPIEVVLLNNTAAMLSIGFSGMVNIEIEPADQIDMTFKNAPTRLFILSEKRVMFSI